MSRFLTAAKLMGLDLRQTWGTVAHVPAFLRSMRTYSRMRTDVRFPLTLSEVYPVLTEMTGSAGTAGGHYFHQDLWAARKVYERRPSRHVDIGSRIDGFVAHLLVFMDVEVIDIRPLESDVRGMRFVQSSATDLSRFADGSIESLSSLHATEHFGLGRYGDPVDPDACFVAMREFARVLATGGRLLFSVPVGRERVQFNAQRVFHPRTVVQAFSDLKLRSFSGVSDAGAFVADADLDELGTAKMACGLFEFEK